MTSERNQRLRRERDGLQQLAEASSLFSFEARGHLPEHYEFRFDAETLGRVSSLEPVGRQAGPQRVDVRLPYSYPLTPPDLRFLTGIFHPNVSFVGFVNLVEVGLPWTSRLELSIVAEWLWDLIRFARVDHGRAINRAAARWLEQENTWELPLDGRPLRDLDRQTCKNLVTYQRRGAKPRLTTPSRDDVLFIDENTPLPDWAIRRRQDGDDLFYIGEDS